MDCSGRRQFETHLSIDASNRIAIDAAREWAHQSDLKWTEIELSRGVHRSQPMITFWGNGTLESQHDAASQIASSLVRLDVRVVRLKHEVDVSPSDMAGLGQYFECHVKLPLTTAADWQTLACAAETHHAHISRNARRVRDEGTEERFLTQRSYACHGREAQQRERALVDALISHGLKIIEVESEFVVFDSNISLDAGWEE